MRLLYYCPEYHSRHGARTHARGFFDALKSLPEVTRADLYPHDPDAAVKTSSEGEAAVKKRELLWFVPKPVRRILYFIRPRSDLTRTLIRLINENSYDAIIIRTGLRQPVFKDLKSACPNTKVYLEINAALFDEGFSGIPLQGMFRQLEVARYKAADSVMVVSDYLEDYLVRYGMPQDKIFVNHNGVDKEFLEKGKSSIANIRSRLDIPDEAFLLGYAGGMEKFRRLPEVIEQVAEMRGKGHKDLYLLIVGDGVEMPAIKKVLNERKSLLDNSVRLVGWKEHGDLPAYLMTCDLAIFPYTNDYCSPLKLFEYLGLGLPSIGPDTPAVREVFKDGEHIRLVNQDGSDFSKVVLELKNSAPTRKHIAESGKDYVLSNYTWKQNAQRVVKHILNSGLSAR